MIGVRILPQTTLGVKISAPTTLGVKVGGEFYKVGDTEDLDAVLTEQEGLIDELKDILQHKALLTQEKKVYITENVLTEVTPDEGKYLSKVTIDVNIPSETPNIQPLEIVENGNYVPSDDVDGYSPITVNVPLRYDEGYNKGFAEGKKDGYTEGYQQGFDDNKSVVEPLEVTKNGTYTPRVEVDGYNPVIVNVPDRFDEGYQAGVEDSVPTLEPLTVTTNGTYIPEDGVDGFSEVIVEVPTGGGGDSSEIESFVGLLENNITDFTSDRITSLSQYAFAYKTELKTISLPNLKSSNTRAFTNCDSLVSLSIPNMTGYTYQYMVAYCGALKTVDVKNASYVSSYSFYGCSSLTKLEFNRVGTIATNAFNGCTKLATLILRSPSVVTLSGTSAFTGTKIAGTGGYIYTPSSLIEDYKVASNWSTYASKFRAIEDYPEIIEGDDI